MLKKIVSISGKSGLFKIISQGKNMLIVESLTDKKRVPAYAHDKVSSLNNIAIYTDDKEVPLHEVLTTMQTKYNNGKADVSPQASSDELRAFFAEILPTFDRERVYPSDIRKIINWYNLLIETGCNDFSPEEEEKESTEAPEVQKEEIAEKEIPAVEKQKIINEKQRKSRSAAPQAPISQRSFQRATRKNMPSGNP